MHENQTWQRRIMAGCSTLGLLLWACIPRGGSAPVTLAGPATSQLAGVTLWVDDDSQASWAYRQAKDRPEHAQLLLKIASQPQAAWFGEWTPDVETAVREQVNKATAAGATLVLVAYDIPYRDCGLYSKGGVKDASAYASWIQSVAKGIGNQRAIVILEPDALAQLDLCLKPADQEARIEMLAQAVKTLVTNPATIVYLDAGNARWQPAEVMAERLERAGMTNAHGFSLNVSNYVGTEETITYGTKLSALVGGKHFIIDTSRNGNGATDKSEWCNPPGRALGPKPTTATGHEVVDAFLWIKRPGESDGTCNGGPPAGQFWEALALEQSRNAQW